MATKKAQAAKKAKEELLNPQEKPEETSKDGEEVPKGEDAEAKVEEKKKKEKRSQKERPKSKKKHTKIQVWTLYEKDGKRKNESCPRCGPGTFIAAFKNRKYCGKCGWAEIAKIKTEKVKA